MFRSLSMLNRQTPLKETAYVGTQHHNQNHHPGTTAKARTAAAANPKTAGSPRPQVSWDPLLSCPVECPGPEAGFLPPPEPPPRVAAFSRRWQHSLGLLQQDVKLLGLPVLRFNLVILHGKLLLLCLYLSLQRGYQVF